MNPKSKSTDDGGESVTVATAAAAAEVLHRVVARAAPALDGAAAASASREAARLAAKHGAKSAVAKAAADHASHLADTHTMSVAAARRAEVPIVVPPEGKAAIVGRVVDAAGDGHKGLTVIARVGDRTVGTATTETHGVFRIDLDPSAGAGDPKQKRVLAQTDTSQGPAHPGTAQLTLEVRKGEQVIHRDDAPVTVVAGRSTYRELVITEK